MGSKKGDSRERSYCVCREAAPLRMWLFAQRRHWESNWSTYSDIWKVASTHQVWHCSSQSVACKQHAAEADTVMTRRKLQHEITNSERKPFHFPQRRALSKSETCKNTVGEWQCYHSPFLCTYLSTKKRLLRQIINVLQTQETRRRCTELQDKQVHDQQPLCAGTSALSVNNYYSSPVIWRFAQLCWKTLCLYLLINLYNSIFLEENVSRGLIYHWCTTDWLF